MPSVYFCETRCILERGVSAGTLSPLSVSGLNVSFHEQGGIAGPS